MPPLSPGSPTGRRSEAESTTWSADKHSCCGEEAGPLARLTAVQCCDQPLRGRVAIGIFNQLADLVPVRCAT